MKSLKNTSALNTGNFLPGHVLFGRGAERARVSLLSALSDFALSERKGMGASDFASLIRLDIERLGGTL